MAMRQPRPTATQKIIDWQRAFWAINDEIGGAVMELPPQEILRNRRQAALAAAILISSGVRPVPVEGES